MYVCIYIYLLLSHHIPSHPTMPEHRVTTGVTTGAAGVTLRAPGGGILGTSCLAGLGCGSFGVDSPRSGKPNLETLETQPHSGDPGFS